MRIIPALRRGLRNEQALEIMPQRTEAWADILKLEDFKVTTLLILAWLARRKGAYSSAINSFIESMYVRFGIHDDNELVQFVVSDICENFYNQGVSDESMGLGLSKLKNVHFEDNVETTLNNGILTIRFTFIDKGNHSSEELFFDFSSEELLRNLELSILWGILQNHNFNNEGIICPIMNENSEFTKENRVFKLGIGDLFIYRMLKSDFHKFSGKRIKDLNLESLKRRREHIYLPALRNNESLSNTKDLYGVFVIGGSTVC